MSNLLVCIIGSSGSGKSTIANRLEGKYGYKSVKSYTTRPIRDDEKDTQTHTFISSAEVQKFKDDMAAYNKYNGYEYFATKQQLDSADLYVVDKPGLAQLRKNYKGKDIIAVYIKCDSSITAKRMSGRGDSDEQIIARLQYDTTAFHEAADLCDFVCINEEPDDLNDVSEFIHSLFKYYNHKRRTE